MKFERMITAIDSHTMGEPTRIVTGNFPVIKGETMSEKKEYLEKNYDHLRKALMHEPRGHADMFGSILTEPVNSKADTGIIFMDSGGYLNMCGHGSIGALKVLVEMGIVEKKEPITNVVLESPAGLINAEVRVENGEVLYISINNVPSFLYKENVTIDTSNYGKLQIDISFGGSFFALVNAKELGIPIELKYTEEFIKIGLKIRDKINKAVDIKHPNLPHINTVDLVEFYDDNTVNPESDLRNVVIFGQSSVDRSPCGTGTSAKMAALYKKGKLRLNQEFIYESIIGTTFKGELVEIANVGDFEAVIPKITANAYITGIQKFVIDPKDPLAYGFSL